MNIKLNLKIYLQNVKFPLPFFFFRKTKVSFGCAIKEIDETTNIR